MTDVREFDAARHLHNPIATGDNAFIAQAIRTIIRESKPAPPRGKR